MNPKRLKQEVATVRPSNEDTCFILMPFNAPYDQYYKRIFVPAVKSTGLHPRRADDLFRPSAILHDIWSQITSCRLLLAELTGQNANVFYEIGMAHALAKPVVMVSQSMQDVPFDLRHLRIIIYDKDTPNWGENLRKSVAIAIKEVLRSPLEAVIPPFVDAKARLGRTDLTDEQAGLVYHLKKGDYIAAAARGLRGPAFARMDDLGTGASEVEGYSRVAHYLSLGVPQRKLIAFMTDKHGPHGFDEQWVRTAIAEVAKRFRSREEK